MTTKVSPTYSVYLALESSMWRTVCFDEIICSRILVIFFIHRLICGFSADIALDRNEKLIAMNDFGVMVVEKFLEMTTDDLWKKKFQRTEYIWMQLCESLKAELAILVSFQLPTPAICSNLLQSFLLLSQPATWRNKEIPPEKWITKECQRVSLRLRYSEEYG